MAIKKSALYASLWASCDELRGGMDGSQYKDYVLTVNALSDKVNAHLAAMGVELNGELKRVNGQ